MEAEYFIGFDVGSECAHSVTLNKNKEIVFSPKSKMHFGDPAKAIKDFLEENKSKGFNTEKTSVSFTGSAGEPFAKIGEVPYFYETLTIPAGANFISPNSSYVFHIGAKNPYYFEKGEVDKRVFIQDNQSGSKCAGGSGLLLTKQCRRLFEGIVSKKLSKQERMEKMYSLAIEASKKHTAEIDVGGRCGVVINSDMIHLQNSGVSMQNILRGLFRRVAINYRDDLIGARELDKKNFAVFTGGVALNPEVVKILQECVGLKIKTPLHVEKVGAIGAALNSIKEGKTKIFDIKKIENILEIQRSKIRYVGPLNEVLKKISFHEEGIFEKIGDLKVYGKADPNKKYFMGIDGGSTTTKAAIIDFEGNPLAEICVETHGRPVDAAQDILKKIKKQFKDNLNISGVAYTGSSGSLYKRLFSDGLPDSKKNPDRVIDEITCHAIGVRKFNDSVDTIFELGGQDAKFTLLDKRGYATTSKMNLSCMAGTGQTMQNLIQMIGLDFEEFEKLALSAKRTPVVDDTCGVFTEADIINLISLGLPKEEIASAIAYGLLGGYVNKFVGNEKFGKNVSAQGGPFNSKACLAALALHTGVKVNAFPHRQLFGAYGAALACIN